MNSSPLFLGIDTSNYTSSAAIVCENEHISKTQLLSVGDGMRGVRQSDAVFMHSRNLPPLLQQLFSEIDTSRIAAVGVSTRPRNVEGSYMPAFTVGQGYAHTIAAALGVPCFDLSHQQGHIAAGLFGLDAFDAPDFAESFYAFHVSGGTTELLLCENRDGDIACQLIGATSDLHAGQVVDRIGVKLGISFPCGKEIDKLAQNADKNLSHAVSVKGLSCSLSGAENLCLRFLENGESAENVALFLLTYIERSLCAVIENAFTQYGTRPILFVGGVMSNSIIRARMTKRFKCCFAPAELSRDNAVGIAALAMLKAKKL